MRIAHETGKTNYALIEPNEENVCNSIQPYIHKKNIFIKKDPTGFGSDDLRKKILEEECTHLMVLGYDRDDFVLDAIKDALESDVEVVTSEEIMLTSDLGDRRRKSLKFFRGNTAYLENLVDVFNYILEH